MKKETLNKTFALFLLLLCFALLINVGTFVLYHEEPTRGIITFEMIKNHNFFQPTVLLQPYFNKPPFHNWLLVVSSLIFGSISEVSLRIPSLISVVLTSILIFFFSSRFFKRKVALFSAVVFPTFFMVLFGYSTKCEPDTLFTLLVSSSILLWYYFMERKREGLAWFLGYLFTSLAALTKGFPAFHFFWIALLVYFLLNREWRKLFSLKHLVGFILGMLPFVFWLTEVPTERALRELLFQVTARAPNHYSSFEILKRYISFPFRFLLATFPWSFILSYYICRERNSYRNVLEDRTATFLLLAFTGNFLIYWLFPGSRMRYTMPIFPLLAIVTAVYLKDRVVSHMRAKSIFQFVVELLVPIGIVAGLVTAHNSSLILKDTIVFLVFAYTFYFFILPRIDSTPVVMLLGLLMVLLRGFYSSYYLSIAEYKYPPVRNVAKKVVEMTNNYPIYSNNYYLQLCFYIENYSNRVLPYASKPPKNALFLSEQPDGNVLKEVSLGKHTFYLCSFNIKRLNSKNLQNKLRK